MPRRWTAGSAVSTRGSRSRMRRCRRALCWDCRDRSRSWSRARAGAEGLAGGCVTKGVRAHGAHTTQGDVTWLAKISGCSWVMACRTLGLIPCHTPSRSVEPTCRVSPTMLRSLRQRKPPCTEVTRLGGVLCSWQQAQRQVSSTSLLRLQPD